MKHYYNIIMMMVLLSVSLQSCQKAGKDELTTIAIEDPVRHYSPVIQGEEQTIAIKVFNTGKNLLNILKVYPSCGCTLAKFPEDAIAPGKYGLVELTYNSNKNMGYVGVYTTIVTNTAEKSNTVFFDLNVVPDADYIRDYEQRYLDKDKLHIDEIVAEKKKSSSKGYRTDTEM